MFERDDGCLPSSLFIKQLKNQSLYITISAVFLYF